jgi:hypothetical protein
LTSLNPASITWELTPFSFVFDWFLDVGGYLKNLESSLVTSSGWASGFMTYGHKKVCNSEIKGSGKSLSSGRYISGARKGSRIDTNGTRGVLVSPPAPRLPTFNSSFGASRLVTAAALLKTLFIQEDLTKAKRRITQLQLQKQLNRFRDGPRKQAWSVDGNR